MWTVFAHAGRSHDSMGFLGGLEHCLPVIIGAVAIIILLFGVIVYLLFTWEPRKKLKRKK